MEYSSWINQVLKLSFINDRQAAESAIKAVLGTLASVVDEREARRLTDALPPELSLGVLRRHQGPLELTQEQFVTSVAKQFQLPWGEAVQLVERVLHCVKESEEGAELIDELQSTLPEDWEDLLDRA